MEVSSILIILLHERGELQISSGDNGENLLFFIRDFNYHEIEEWDLRAAGSSQWKLMNLPGGPKVVGSFARYYQVIYQIYGGGTTDAIALPSSVKRCGIVSKSSVSIRTWTIPYFPLTWDLFIKSKQMRYWAVSSETQTERESYLGDGGKLPSGYL